MPGVAPLIFGIWVDGTGRLLNGFMGHRTNPGAVAKEMSEALCCSKVLL